MASGVVVVVVVVVGRAVGEMWCCHGPHGGSQRALGCVVDLVLEPAWWTDGAGTVVT